MSRFLIKYVLALILLVIFGSLIGSVQAQKNEITIPVGAYSPLCEKRDECFVPTNLIIEKGSKVVWINRDYALHTVTSGTIWAGHDKLFNSNILDRNDKFEFTFSIKPATYTYYCLIHPWMKGSITVRGQAEFQA